MKYLLLLIGLFFIASPAYAVTIPSKPDSGFILDQSNKLTPTQMKLLNDKISNLEDSTKNEYGIAIINSLGGYPIEDVAQDTFRSWGIGKANLHNGILIMIATGDRKIRIQTGKGVEGDLPDLAASTIIKEKIAPNLKRNDFYTALNSALDAIASKLESRAQQEVVAAPPVEKPNAVPVVEVATSSESKTSSSAFMLILGVFLTSGLAGIWLFKRNQRNREREREAEIEEALRAQARNEYKRRINEEVKRKEQIRNASPLPNPITPQTNSINNTRFFGTPQVAPVVSKPQTARLVKEGLAFTPEQLVAKRLAEKQEAQDAARKKVREEKRRYIPTPVPVVVSHPVYKQTPNPVKKKDDIFRDTWNTSKSPDSSDSWSNGGGWGGGDSGGGGASGDY